MYLNHFNLKEKPFTLSPDSRFLWLSEKHREALATLKYAIMEEKGFLLLTGEVGTGKTLLIRALTRIISVKTIIATLPDPDLEIMDFFKILVEEFNMNKVFRSKAEFLIQFKEFLLESYGSDKKVLLIIDEAQRLNSDLLEQIRLLSNIEMDYKKLINIFFVGQNEFNRTLVEDRNRAVRQRIAVSYRLDPFTLEETATYIRYRLMKAGSSEEIFKQPAIREVFKISRGYPRLINIICDSALVAAYSAGLKKIDAAMVKQCDEELHISIGTNKKGRGSSNPHQRVRPQETAAVREKPQGGMHYGIAVIVMLFSIFAAYQIYGSLRESPPRWDTEEFAPKNENSLLEKQREALKTEIENSRNGLKDQAAAAIAMQDDTETTTTAEASIARENDENDQADKSESARVDSTERHSAALFIGRRSIIYFEHNSNELPPNAYATLDTIGESISQRPDLKITVEGYTDSYGDPVYNRQLSKYRADMVKNYLIGHGIQPANITAIGRGPENPIKSNRTFEGRKQNRRVEIQIEAR